MEAGSCKRFGGRSQEWQDLEAVQVVIRIQRRLSLESRMGPDCGNSFLPAQDIHFMLYLVKKLLKFLMAGIREGYFS